MVSFPSVLLRPFQLPVALMMSSPTFLGVGPKGPILGTRAGEMPTSPLVYLRCVTLSPLGSNLGGVVEAAGVGMTEDSCAFTLSKLTAKQLKEFILQGKGCIRRPVAILPRRLSQQCGRPVPMADSTSFFPGPAPDLALYLASTWPSAPYPPEG